MALAWAMVMSELMVLEKLFQEDQPMGGKGMVAGRWAGRRGEQSEGGESEECEATSGCEF